MQLLFVPLLIIGADWNQFRGPTGQGISDARGLPVEWSETVNVTWKTPLPGRGWSSPVIRANQIWVTAATDDGRSLRALAVDRETGKVLLDVEVFQLATPVPVNAKNSHASPTPIVEDDRVYVHFGTSGTACLSAVDGKVLWRNTEQVVDHKEGPGSSPVLCDNLLVFHCDGVDVQFVVALDKRTGQVVWKQNRSVTPNANPDFRKAYCTPLVIDVAGRPQIISPGADRVSAFDPLDGREIWFCDYKGFSNVPRPLFAHGLVYVCTGYGKTQLLAIRPDGQGDVTQTHVTWRFTRQVPHNASPIVGGNELFMVDDKGIATCLDALTGEEVWRERLGDTYWASPVFADGRIYFGNEAGESIVIAPTREYKQLAQNKLDGSLMASPAVAERALFLRTDTHLYRIENKSLTSRAR